MRPWWILAATGCWTATGRAVVEPPPAPPVARPGTCTIRDRFDDGARPMKSIELAVDGEVFARPQPPETLELVVTPAGTATATTDTEVMRLTGELDLGKFDVRTRDPAPREGWLAVRTANVANAKGALAHLVVFLPKGLAPRTEDIDVPCVDLTSVASAEDDVAPAGDEVQLALGAHLRKTPRGDRVARVVEDALDARVIAREGDMVRVVIGGEESSVYAWVSSSEVGTPRVAHSATGWGTIGTGRYGTSRSISCSRELTIYAQSSRLGRVQVGILKPDQRITVTGKHPTPTDATGVLLNGDIATYVLNAEVAACP